MKEKLRETLSRRPPRRITEAGRVASAVLLPIYLKEGQYHIIFIRRTETVKVHKGQISFPGGHHETPDRTLLTTALREAQEEIGLDTKDADVLGELDDAVTTTSNYIVSPFVAAVPYPYRFRMNRDEVAEIIEVPIAALLEKGYRNRETFPDGQTLASYTYRYRGKTIWGATARILHKFLEIYRQAMPDVT